jgi:hypothetical protein
MKNKDDIVKVSFDIEATDLIDFALLVVIKRRDRAEYKREATAIIQRLEVWLDLIETGLDARHIPEFAAVLERALANAQRDPSDEIARRNGEK